MGLLSMSQRKGDTKVAGSSRSYVWMLFGIPSGSTPLFGSRKASVWYTSCLEISTVERISLSGSTALEGVWLCVLYRLGKVCENVNGLARTGGIFAPYSKWLDVPLFELIIFQKFLGAVLNRSAWLLRYHS